MVKRHLENEPAKEARITAFMAEWGTAQWPGGKQRCEALKVLTAELGFSDHRNVSKYYNQWLIDARPCTSMHVPHWCRPMLLAETCGRAYGGPGWGPCVAMRTSWR